MEPVLAANYLADVAVPERTGDRAATRLAEVRAALADDLAFIEVELERHSEIGLRPATEAAKHLLSAGGKRVRPMVVLLSAALFGKVPAEARDLAIVSELVHLATLLHDDVIDDGDERRGSIASRRIYGNAVSVLAGDLLLTHALERTARTSPNLLPSLVSTLRKLVDGEVVQLRGRVRLDTQQETYLRIVADKTASLFAWAAEAGAAIAGASEPGREAMRRFGEHVGIAFQLVDDALDFAIDPHVTGKSLLADVREGKLTLPLLFAIEMRPSLERELEAVRLGDDAAAIALAQAVRASDACERTRALASHKTRQALEALATAPPGRVRDLLGFVARELASRAA
jgi:octaprenyl-diphosphate synthase